MKITNIKGLSPTWIQVINETIGGYDKAGWRSVTQLIDSPRVQLLVERHDKEIEQDASKMIWAVLGTAVHSILELAADKHAITEQRIVVSRLGKLISMKADRIEPIPGTDPKQYCIKDYKILRTHAWKMGPSFNQTAQNNLYRWGYGTLGFNCTRGALEMLLRDWSETEYLRSPHDYPASEVEVLPIETWPNDKIEAYLDSRIKLYIDCEQLPDDKLPYCSIQERWGRPDRWAVRKAVKGKLGEKACPGAANFLSEHEANEWIKTKKPKTGESFHTEFRCGENVRCDRFCLARAWCNQYAEIATKAAF